MLRKAKVRTKIEPANLNIHHHPPALSTLHMEHMLSLQDSAATCHLRSLSQILQIPLGIITILTGTPTFSPLFIIRTHRTPINQPISPIPACSLPFHSL